MLTFSTARTTSCDPVTVCIHVYLCLQETKLQEAHVSDMIEQVGLQDWHVTFNCSTAKKGYSGTATLCRSVAEANGLLCFDTAHMLCMQACTLIDMQIQGWPQTMQCGC